MTRAALPDQDRILILDYGSQYTQLIARSIRELGVYCEIFAPEIDADQIKAFTPSGVVLSGGPASVNEQDTPTIPAEIFSGRYPVLGICYGMQALALHLGGEVETAEEREYGPALLTLTGRSALLDGLGKITDGVGDPLQVWMSHGDRVSVLPPGFVTIATSPNAPHAAIAHHESRIFGLQFHPEVTHSVNGREILRRFLFDICSCQSHWKASNIIDQMVENIRGKVGSDRVLLGLSGGVDSAVVAALLHRAIGDQLICVFVDNGLLRKDEQKEVRAMFADHLGVNVMAVNAQDQFLDALRGVSDPEEKRRIIGHVFIDVFQEAASNVGLVNWLAQGTIYPDVIESAGIASGKAKVIKSHHNVGGLPEHLDLKLLEPIRSLFKDEVRQIGLELGLARSVVFRHPFPGPGLGVRVLGEVRREFLEIVREADAIFLEELRKAELYDSVSQAFAVFLPVKSVGVVGDNRAYEYVIALRAVETVDYMTADWKRLPAELLTTVASRIINEVRGVSRVTYDISAKPPATIEWE